MSAGRQTPRELGDVRPDGRSRLVVEPHNFPAAARKDGETMERWVQRLITHAWYFDATDTEIAELAECDADLVERVRREFTRSAKVRSMIAHANAVSERLGWKGTPSELVTVALEKYAAHQSLIAALDLAAATHHAADPEERQSAPATARESTNEGGPSGQQDGRAPAMPGGTGRKAGALTSDASDGGRREADRSGLVRGSSHGDTSSGLGSPRRQITGSTPNPVQQTASRTLFGT